MIFAEVSETVRDAAFYLGVVLAFGGVMKLVVNASLNGIDIILERRLRPFADQVDTIRDELSLNGGESMKDVVVEVRNNQRVMADRFGDLEHRQRAMLDHFGLDEGLIPRRPIQGT